MGKVFLSENFCIVELYGEILQTEVNSLRGNSQIRRTVIGNAIESKTPIEKSTFFYYLYPRNNEFHFKPTTRFFNTFFEK